MSPKIERRAECFYVDPDTGNRVGLVGAEALQRGGPVILVTLLAPMPRLSISLPPKSVTGLAMIDTGADRTAIDLGAARELGLEPIDTTTVYGNAGGVERPTFAFDLDCRVPGEPLARFPEAPGLDMSRKKYVALLGRDFLKGKVLTYRGDLGQFLIEW